MAALTSSADMQLKIWCIKTGVCAATLAPGIGGGVSTGCETPEPGGHCSGVMDTGIVDRGRNIVSVDRLGWLRLWDVSTQICISAIPTVPDAVSNHRCISSPLEVCVCVAVKQQQENCKLPLPDEEVPAEESSQPLTIETCSTTTTEVGTNDCLVAVGMGREGGVQLYDLGARSRGCVLRVCLPEKGGGSVESCAFPVSLSADDISPCATGQSSFDSTEDEEAEAGGGGAQANTVEPVSAVNTFLQYGLVAGGQTGEVAAWDLRYPSRTLVHLTGEKSAVHHLRAYKKENERSVRLVTGRSDGRVVMHPMELEPLATNGTDRYLELTGIDCEPVVGLQLTGDGRGQVRAWTASYGGVFRFYNRLATEIAFQM